jgi:hypothetical protein
VAADSSNLILDPELDSSHLIDNVITKLPLLIDTTGQTGDRALLAGSTGLSIEARIELAFDKGSVETTVGQQKEAFEAAFRNTHDGRLEPALGGPLSSTLKSSDTFLDALTAAVNAEAGAIYEASKSASATAGNALVLEQATLPRLDSLLATRIGKLEGQKQRVTLWAIPRGAARDLPVRRLLPLRPVGARRNPQRRRPDPRRRSHGRLLDEAARRDRGHRQCVAGDGREPPRHRRRLRERRRARRRALPSPSGPAAQQPRRPARRAASGRRRTGRHTGSRPQPRQRPSASRLHLPPRLTARLLQLDHELPHVEQAHVGDTNSVRRSIRRMGARRRTWRRRSRRSVPARPDAARSGAAAEAHPHPA